jgi:hypothetical protein
MNYTIFYSWQSDLESRFNRSFIQEVIEKATKIFSKDENFSLDAVVDRDTYGIAGSPSIVESITGKIAKSDVFVCDISIINFSSTGRSTPNPNVLYELGFASAILGWERIIMIQNTAYGSIEMLPFDLRGRRILQYNLDTSIENRSEEKNKLKKTLVEIFQNALKHYGNDSITKEKIVWWGKWNIDSKIKVRGGQLRINRVSSDAFLFNISIYDGARSGQISGKAQIITPHSAYAKIKTFDDKECRIVFRRRLENGEWFIEVDEGENCNYFHGHNATFSGHYKHETEMIIDQGYIDEIELNEIERITGKYLSTFLENFQQFGFGENLDGEDFTVITAGVKGLYTIMESIVVLNKFGYVWCAFIDPEINSIRYFSNKPNENQDKPKSIQFWLNRLSEKDVIENDKNEQHLNEEF